MERSLVEGMGMTCYFVPMAPPTTARAVALLVLASARALLLILRTRPRVTFGTGGYVSVPAALASWLLRVPVVLFLPDVIPGKAVSRLVPLTRVIAVATDDSLRYLPARKVVVTGYPVREEFLRATRQGGRARFGVPNNATVLFVTGGSLGSRSLNSALAACLPWLLEQSHVIHVTGSERHVEATKAAERVPSSARERYHLFPYLNAEEMADAMAAADLCLCRAGASTLGEIPATGTPAVLVPLPIAGVNQRANAEYLVAGGAAVMLDDEGLDQRLPPVLETLLTDRERLDAMAVAARRMARPEAADAIARLLLETAG